MQLMPQPPQLKATANNNNQPGPYSMRNRDCAGGSGMVGDDVGHGRVRTGGVDGGKKGGDGIGGGVGVVGEHNQPWG